MEPQVLGPDAIPCVDSTDAAVATPELAVLSAVAHGNNPDVGPQIALAATTAALGMKDELARVCYDLVRAALNEATRAALEELMAQGNYEYQSDFAKKYVAEGRAEGRA